MGPCRPATSFKERRIKTMPMIDVCIPQGALAPEAEKQLMEELTSILIRHEGLEPTNERVRAVTWVFLHRTENYRAGVRSSSPLYRIAPIVPEGQYTDEARQSLVREVTAAIARAENSGLEDVSARVWVFPTEIFDGGWGSRGMIRRVPDIMEYFGGKEAGAAFRARGEQRLAAKRRKDALALLKGLVDVLEQGLTPADELYDYSHIRPNTNASQKRASSQNR